MCCRFLLPASLIVINDIMAYFFGVFFGRTPLIKLSPKKTWEGFIGASITTVLSAFIVSLFPSSNNFQNTTVSWFEQVHNSNCDCWLTFYTPWLGRVIYILVNHTAFLYLSYKRTWHVCDFVFLRLVVSGCVHKGYSCMLNMKELLGNIYCWVKGQKGVAVFWGKASPFSSHTC